MTQVKLLGKTLALFLVMCVFATNLKSQINIQFNNINEYLFNTKQVLNLSVINLNTKPVDVYFIGFIKDGQSQRVVEFKTNTTTLNQGNNLLNSMNFDFSELNYLNPDILEIEEKSGSYPYGLYSICIQVRCATSDCNGLGATASSSEEITCINVNIENPTPLILAHPEDESEIEETKPLYTWIPPSPVARSSNLNYTMRLVEMMEGQNKSDALTMNRPIIEMSGIGQPSLMHPLDVPELEKGKWYAWQVEAFVGNTPIAQSEQWKFKVKKEEKKVEKPSYVILKTDDQNIYNVREILNITYIESYIPQNLTINIYSNDGKLVFNNSTDFKTIRGENSFEILLNNLNINKKEIYILKVLNLNNEIYTLRFIAL